MRKKKIDFKKYANMHDEKELTGKDGTVITVRNHIPYADKIQLCRDVVENCVMIHDDSCCYENININSERIKAVLKYYTNVSVDDVDADMVADFAINNDLYDQIIDYIHDDFYKTEDIYVTMFNMVMDTYTDDMSLKKAIKKSFGFLWNGEDVTESLAKAESTSSVLFDALGALRDAQKEKEENVNNGQLSVGGNIINFAKREQ